MNFRVATALPSATPARGTLLYYLSLESPDCGVGMGCVASAQLPSKRQQSREPRAEAVLGGGNYHPKFALVPPVATPPSAVASCPAHAPDSAPLLPTLSPAPAQSPHWEEAGTIPTTGSLHPARTQIHAAAMHMHAVSRGPRQKTYYVYRYIIGYTTQKKAIPDNVNFP